jgi:hypothetical protein
MPSSLEAPLLSTAAMSKPMEYTIQDAGRMWIITAKEGDPLA